MEYDSLDQIWQAVSIDNSVEVDLRRLLELNGNVRRGKYVVASINEELRERGLVVEPDLERADYWGSVTISDPRSATRAPHPPGLPVSSVAADAPELIWVKSEASLEEVETLMIMSDFSQIPVMNSSRRELRGTVTWKSIARSRANGQVGATAKDVMTIGGRVAESSDNLMDLVPAILAEDFIYFRNREKEIVGIVTATDLAATFQNSTGLFVRIGEIESRLRLILDQLPIPELEKMLDESIKRDNFRGASDMTFGEYIRVLENPERWDALKLGLDRKVCIKNLKKIAELRNEIMHFRSGAEQEDDERHVLSCLKWLEAVSATRTA